MARWEEEGRWGSPDDDRWRGRPGERTDRDRFGMGTTGPRGGGEAGGGWSGRGDWGGGGRREMGRGSEWRGSEERGPREYLPQRRGDDYGAREYGAEDFPSRRETYPGGGEYGDDETRSSRRGEGWSGGGWRERGGARDRGWDEGDYTTYGQSAYGSDYDDRGRGMHEGIRREQGRGMMHGERATFAPSSGGHGMSEHGWRHEHERGAFERFGDRVKEGVRKLTGRGPKGYKRSDERIHDDVCEQIARSGLNADDVEVRVENGEVTLTGNAESREEKRMMEDLADEVFGVQEVHNHIRVNRGMHDPSSSADVRH